jgi:MFS transporter, MHS family, alpha-ketoglutarate permease
MNEATPSASEAAAPITQQHRLKAIVGGSIGNLVEWYDWYAYAAFAIYFSSAFFPQANATAQLLQTAGIFAAGFFMRPLGGWLFGSLADRKGRKFSMTASVLLMSFGSLLIACTPSYKSIGIAAPALLLLARLIQGLSVGGEYGSSATYLSEMATKNLRGFYSSFQYVTLIGGQLLALGVQLILQKWWLSDEALKEWGWRIPFFIGAILSVVAFYIRNHLRETDAFLAIKKSGRTNEGRIMELAKHPRAVISVIGLTLGGTVAFYTYTVYLQKFFVLSAGLSKADATTVSFVCLLCFALVQPLFGLLSDKIGRRPLLLSFGLLGTIGTVPLLHAAAQVQTPGGAMLLMGLGLLIVSGYTSINAIVKAELFPSNVRALGVGLPYALTTALFGGTAEYVALWLKNKGHESWFYWYVAACVFVSFLVYLRMSDTRKTSLMDKA